MISSFVTIESHARIDPLAFNEASQFFKDPHLFSFTFNLSVEHGELESLKLATESKTIEIPDNILKILG